MSKKRTVTVRVNGTEYTREVETRMTLVDFLRHELRLTGTHVGCEHGVCGACTVLLDGLSIRSCLMLAIQANGKQLETVEGLAPNAQELSPLQAAFWENHGLQCGFCTPGVLMTLTEHLRANPDSNESEIREVLSGNICRCTGYAGIVAAALQAARVMRGQPVEKREHA
ncbi:MAG: (2Fe-2S)-binding protein [Pseudolabrys sp.]|nr:(2Fe-2S)-binding protein [Pseudolabrys sp.]